MHRTIAVVCPMRGNLIFATALVVCTAASHAQLTFDSTHVRSDGSVEMKLTGVPGGHYIIEASPDMIDWAELSSITLEQPNFELTDSQAISFTSRFYRGFEITEPANDNFSSRTAVTGAALSLVGHNFGASEEPGEPSHSHFDDGNRSVWWSWTAPAAGVVRISAIGSLFNTLIAAYTGSSVSTLQTVAKQPFYSKILQFDAAAGATYHIAVDGHFGATGVIKLRMRLDPFTSGVPPAELGGLRVNFEELSDPNTPPRVVQFSNDGLAWFETENGKTNIIESGRVVSYTPAGTTATLKLEGIRGEEILPYDYVLDFRSASDGTYRYTLYGEFRGSGLFADLRNGSSNLAPPDLAGRSMVGTRTTSSAGSGGQTHFYAFDLYGRFHDSDGAEHGSGAFRYFPDGSTAVLVLDYGNSADLAGDRATMELVFESPTHGSYTSEYRRNDGAVVAITGEFVLGR